MEVYLVQHGEAKREEEDPARALTDRGKREAEGVARAAGRAGLALAEILHSGKRRAQETAEIFAVRLKPSRGVREAAGLAPMDDPAAAEGLIEGAAGPLMLVGHLPHMGRLASLLLAADPGKEIIAFRMGGIVCLSREEGGWRLRWMLTPEVAAG
jgi:phosphohistidine phosphatase